MARHPLVERVLQIMGNDDDAIAELVANGGYCTPLDGHRSPRMACPTCGKDVAYAVTCYDEDGDDEDRRLRKHNQPAGGSCPTRSVWRAWAWVARPETKED